MVIYIVHISVLVSVLCSAHGQSTRREDHGQIPGSSADYGLLERHWNALQAQVSQLDNEITVLREGNDKLETDNKKLANDTKKLIRDVEHLQHDRVRSDKGRAKHIQGL